MKDLMCSNRKMKYGIARSKGSAVDESVVRVRVRCKQSLTGGAPCMRKEGGAQEQTAHKLIAELVAIGRAIVALQCTEHEEGMNETHAHLFGNFHIEVCCIPSLLRERKNNM